MAARIYHTSSGTPIPRLTDDVMTIVVMTIIINLIEMPPTRQRNSRHKKWMHKNQGKHGGCKTKSRTKKQKQTFTWTSKVQCVHTIISMDVKPMLPPWCIARNLLSTIVETVASIANSTPPAQVFEQDYKWWEDFDPTNFSFHFQSMLLKFRDLLMHTQ